MSERKAVTGKQATRYRKTSKKGQEKIPDEFIELTDYIRKCGTSSIKEKVDYYYGNRSPCVFTANSYRSTQRQLYTCPHKGLYFVEQRK